MKTFIKQLFCLHKNTNIKTDFFITEKPLTFSAETKIKSLESTLWSIFPLATCNDRTKDQDRLLQEMPIQARKILNHILSLLEGLESATEKYYEANNG